MEEKIFYSIPFLAERIIKGQRLERCDLETSVRQNLRLLLMTPPMRVRHDPAYQCKIHWLQFLAENGAMEEDKRMEDNLKMLLEKNVKQLIEKFEPRVIIRELAVSVKYPNEQFDNRSATQLRLKRRKENNIQIVVNIKALIRPEYLESGEDIPLTEQIPLF